MKANKLFFGAFATFVLFFLFFFFFGGSPAHGRTIPPQSSYPKTISPPPSLITAIRLDVPPANPSCEEPHLAGITPEPNQLQPANPVPVQVNPSLTIPSQNPEAPVVADPQLDPEVEPVHLEHHHLMH